LENGANSSFVSVAADPAVPIAAIIRRPQDWIGDVTHARNAKIPLPRDLYGKDRRNSAGVAFGDRASLDALLAEVRAAETTDRPRPVWAGRAQQGGARPVRSRVAGKPIGGVGEGDDGRAAAPMAAAQAGFAAGGGERVERRAAALERASDLL